MSLTFVKLRKELEDLGAPSKPVSVMPPLFGIAYFIGTIFTLLRSPHRLVVHAFPYVLTLDLYIGVVPA